MALIKGKLIDLSRPAVSSDDADVISVTGNHLVTAAETAAAAAGDVLQLVKLPSNAKVVDCKVYASIALGGVANLVEISDVAGVVVAGSTLVTAAAINTIPARLNNAAALNLAPTAAEQYVSVVLGAAGTLPAGTIVSVQLSYRNEWFGE